MPFTMKMTRLDLNQIGTNFSDDDVTNAIKSGDCKRLLILIKKGFVCEIDKKDQTTGRTYLHMVVQSATPSSEVKFVPMVYQLSNAGIDVDACDAQGKSALSMTIRNSLLELMIALLKVGAVPGPDDENSISVYTKLFSYEFHSWFKKLYPGYWETVRDNNTFRVNKLVKSWCRINLHKCGTSVTEFAKETNCDPKLIELLVKNEASMEFAHAMIAGDRERMELLLCNDAVDLDIKDFSHREDIFSRLTPISLKETAIKYRQDHVLDLLQRPKGQTKPRTYRVKETNVKSSICSIS